MNFNRFSILLVGLSCLPATAATILFEQQIWHDPLHIASIKVTTTVLDNYNGDFAVNEWRYTIENVDFFDNYYPDCSIQPCPGMFFDLRTGFPHSFDDTASRFYGRDTDGWRWEHYDWALERLIDYPLEHMWVNYEGGVDPTESVTFSLIGPPAHLHRGPAVAGAVVEYPIGAPALDLFRGTVPVPGPATPEPSASLLIASGGILLMMLARYRRRVARVAIEHMRGPSE